MKNILCYGDSNTWGFVAGKFDMKTMYMERYPRDIRWTGRLQKLLGDDFYVIEEGLNGRTTNLEGIDPPDRNGKTYLLPCLYTHSPLDLVVLMLGCNDLKNVYGRTAEDIANGAAELIQMIQSTKYGKDMQSPPKILLVGYPAIAHDKAGINYGDKDLFKDAVIRSKQFNFYFSAVAKKYGCHYFDMEPHITMSEVDGIHLDEKGHGLFADFISVEIKKVLRM
ncbi:MAG: hydrolase [Gammaproteobacteria bacterium CG_4_10_14_0_8_um_filter_38_16]|nr:MAG: hydrolase [Gammaproteobacteria bacterium CG_4_10_14_0_8_um_filter_38_16]PJA03567.1 MAG: hydrolase [Gammaproteobacteria bacterium CG_4_10_14_0_2_um_filter_38_22]PJB10136.1 MAG: hydrolase [Gammaproteobacteria bacterium CG_4_9_14_3_um_filter_38_9]